MRKLTVLRRASQLFFSGLFVYVLWSTTYPLAGNIPPRAIFLADPNIMFFTSISERLFLPGIWVSVLMIVLAFTAGRFFCGWVCPLGSAMDASVSLRNCRLSRRPGKTSARLRKFKFFILAAIAVCAAAGIEAAWVLDPMGIAARFVSLNLIPSVTLGLEKLFIFLVRTLSLTGGVYDVYRDLRMSLLGIKVSYFSSSGVIFLCFIGICAASMFIPRFWCRAICPLGAIYAIASRMPFLRRTVSGCVECGRCADICRMGAIDEGWEYTPGECILCMDCVYACPADGARFVWTGGPSGGKKEGGQQGIRSVTRKDFIFLVVSSFLAAGAWWLNREGARSSRTVIRPPGALGEEDFRDRCVRCGNCMKICPTNGLQPTMLETGLSGVWTPRLVPEIGYCEYNCTLCGDVCPSGAIPRLSAAEKKTRRLGTAIVDRPTCIAWARNEECIVCEEHCPVPDKAIKVIESSAGGRVVKKPYVDPGLCIGCGICQTRCPVRPVRAIRVTPA